MGLFEMFVEMLFEMEECFFGSVISPSSLLCLVLSFPPRSEIPLSATSLNMSGRFPSLSVLPSKFSLEPICKKLKNNYNGQTEQ